MTPSDIDRQLMTFWMKVLVCSECSLDEGYGPQFRPAGPNYKKDGIVFAQINPGHIGRLTEEEIRKRYKSKHGRSVARKKAKSTNELIALQKSFVDTGSGEAWSLLCGNYLDVMRHVWGWHPGKYAKTIENHGVAFDSVAIINLAQCPIPNDRYHNEWLVQCTEKHTYGLIEILKPRLIVAQGKTVYRFLDDNPRIRVPVVEGVHHASRQRKDVKDELLRGVKDVAGGR